MKLTMINANIKCDTVMCNKTSTYRLSTESYKGDTFLCEECYLKLQKLFKRTSLKNEQK